LFRISVGRVFISQAVPSGGLSGDAVVASLLDRPRFPQRGAML
jgi:hypothetical protein